MEPFSKFAFYTLGCKLNFSESSSISKDFIDSGFAKVSFDEFADFYIINTCSVTENADKKCKGLVKKAKSQNPDSKVIVIGCYAQLKPKEISEIPGVNLVLGANEKFDILSFLKRAETDKNKVFRDNIKLVQDFQPGFSSGDRTRSFLKVQDGCDYFCTFCTIPLARGKSRNASIDETLIKAKEVALTGAKEVVLTGVNIGDFGQGSSKENFLGLIEGLEGISSIDRFRISSIEPNLLSDEIITFVSKSKKFVPHFHIPLQSGVDSILKKMRRKYDRTLYKNRIETIFRLMPEACIGVDVIVGFPGEEDDDFEETYNFLKDLNVSYLHVFTYSERANTTAVKLPGIVSKEKRKERRKRLQILSSKLKRSFYEKYIGSEHSVLFEAKNDDGNITGFTENYIKVKHTFDSALVNSVKKVKLTKIDSDGLMHAKTLN
ncbi:MAG: tRNA (N(6)-L-threonylcarbamoyladenosine(37)-C(2))-methylthiotransferase MtaB [Flavobacteriales bacterium]|nr:tRNA (N(6)-L-threonylcarbamoyladenosine(37)-C(2))-methylthiotransferase MtaB [Flavobacteriales bacterium]